MFFIDFSYIDKKKTPVKETKKQRRKQVAKKRKEEEEKKWEEWKEEKRERRKKKKEEEEQKQEQQERGKKDVLSKCHIIAARRWIQDSLKYHKSEIDAPRVDVARTHEQFTLSIIRSLASSISSAPPPHCNTE